MSNAERPPTNRPASGAKPEPLHRALSVQFHPPIKLDRGKGLQFASALSSAMDATAVELEEKGWALSQPLGTHPAGRFTVGVNESALQIESVFPTDSEETFETKAGFILKEFEKFSRPEILLGSGAIIRATLQINGDARDFLAEHVVQFDMARLRPLGRPVHAFGIRLMMPPFQVATNPKAPKKKTAKSRLKTPPKVTSSTEWSADVKAESWIEDPTKLFLEIVANWQTPHQWADDAREDVVSRLATVSNFIQKNFIPFLTSGRTEDS